MISKKICLLFMILIIFSSCSPAEHIPEKVMASEGGSEYEMNMKRDILCLLMAYPEYVTGISREASGNVYLLLKSGKRVLYDDKKYFLL